MSLHAARGLARAPSVGPAMRRIGPAMRKAGATMRRVGAAACWLWLATPHALAAQEDSGIFSLNLGLMVWTWVLFLATLFILGRWAYPAISAGLERRHAKIQGAIDEAQAAREEAQALLARQKEVLEEAHREAGDILERARNAAEVVRSDILDEARRVQTQLLEDAQRENTLERDRLREEIRAEAADIALAAAERLIRSRLDAAENRRLVQEFVSKI